MSYHYFLTFITLWKLLFDSKLWILFVWDCWNHNFDFAIWNFQAFGSQVLIVTLYLLITPYSMTKVHKFLTKHLYFDILFTFILEGYFLLVLMSFINFKHVPYILNIITKSLIVILGSIRRCTLRFALIDSCGNHYSIPAVCFCFLTDQLTKDRGNQELER